MKILKHISRFALALSILAILVSLEFGPASAQTFVASLTLGPGQAPRAAGIDTVHGFAYFGTATDPGMIIKVDLSTFKVVATLAMTFDYVSSVLVDSANGFLYVGSITVGMVTKISLASFTIVGTTPTFDVNRGAALDSVHGFAYYGGVGGIVTRMRLSDFTSDRFIELHTPLFSANVDPSGGFVYFGDFSAEVFQIRLSDFALVQTLHLPEEKFGALASAIDTLNGFLYYGNAASPARVFRISLPKFEKVTTLILSTGQNDLGAAVIDVSRGSVFFSGTGPSTGFVAKISLSTFKEVGALTLQSGVNDASFGATIDITAGFAYFGFGPFFSPTPGTIVKIAE